MMTLAGKSQMMARQRLLHTVYAYSDSTVSTADHTF